MQRAFVHLLTTLVSLAFVASLFAVPALAAPAAKKGGAAFDAARFAMLQVAKPSARKAEGARAAGPALAAGLAAPPVLVSHHVVVEAPTTWTPPAPDRSELMVFLN